MYGKNYNEKQFYGLLIKGNLREAMEYLGKFKEQKEKYDKYIQLFEKEEYKNYDGDSDIDDILLIYQKYYREVFYLNLPEEEAREHMRRSFVDFFAITDKDKALGDIEENEISDTFKSHSLEFLGGKTGGYFGPYIWKETQRKKFDVELPGGVQEYTVMLLDGFISRSWLDYISFGEVGTGGWTNGDGVINCIKASYDFDSENFKVSLLKHEAQHARDKVRFPNMSSEELEYRAKLVELIYSSERNLLNQFCYEADDSEEKNGHAVAASRIVSGFRYVLKDDKLEELSISRIQEIANLLFVKEEEKWEKYL